jgi:hypothetical protein
MEEQYMRKHETSEKGKLENAEDDLLIWIGQVNAKKKRSN